MKKNDLCTDYSNSSYTQSYKTCLEGIRADSSEILPISTSESGDDYLVSVGQSTTADYTASGPASPATATAND